MARLNELLKRKHPGLWQNLEDKQLDPQFYSFRWLTLLLSQVPLSLPTYASIRSASLSLSVCV
jgi:hypothetical protein